MSVGELEDVQAKRSLEALIEASLCFCIYLYVYNICKHALDIVLLEKEVHFFVGYMEYILYILNIFI